jgi:3-hydroxyisobutyrate dehydrogenase-like beta-hydroxyacid dehydrogenase
VHLVQKKLLQNQMSYRDDHALWIVTGEGLLSGLQPNRIHTRDFGNVGLDFLSAFKDVQLILQSSSDVRVPLPYANTIRDKFLAAIANDLERKDWISIYEITRMLAGLKK